MCRSITLRNVLEALTLLLLLGHAALIAVNYQALPQNVPTHFDFRGQPDAFGPRSTLWSVWLTSLGLYGLFSLLNILPLNSRWWNLPERLKQDRSGRGRQLVDEMLAAFKILTASIFLLLTWATLLSIWGYGATWLTPVLLTLATIAPLLVLGRFIALATSVPRDDAL